TTMIYFAYGSNMDETRMRKRCPSAQFMFTARLSGFRLAFTRYSTTNRCGAADIISEPHGAVWGVVYQIKDEDRAALDKAEGVAVRAYKPISVEVCPDGDDARRIKALTYVVVKREDPHPKPSAEYKAMLVNGAKAWKLPADYIAELEKIEIA
ncbi:MAG: gamma-glutamylcyclotransferase family protein, partial [Limisphaerales bacterium]